MADSSTSFPFKKAALLKLHSKHLKGSPVFLKTLSAEVCCKDSSGVIPPVAQVQLAGVFLGSCLCASKSSL